MENQSQQNSSQESVQAVEHINHAHELLRSLQERIGKHPEIGAAITKLEMALNVLAVRTGGVL